MRKGTNNSSHLDRAASEALLDPSVEEGDGGAWHIRAAASIAACFASGGWPHDLRVLP